jgi:15-cis-phytoene synthase
MRPISGAADLAACRRVLRRESRTFHAASLLLPARVRGPASALYAFCRLADDAVDCPSDQPASERLDQLRIRLERVYAGRPLPLPVDRALADVVERFAIPKRILEALFEGFEWNIEGQRPADLGDLHAYAARVAGTVGAMMAVLMGQRSADVVARACDLGVAMQLSNIARDVGEDARAGRIYLPQDWLREVGIDPDAWLARPVFSEALGGVVMRVLDAADVLYRRADDGIARLPADCRPGIAAARHLYAGIGCQVAAMGGDSIARRAVVPASRKARLLARGLIAAATERGSGVSHPPLEATRFLVEAVASNGVPAVLPEVPPDQVIWLIMLFERLERGQRAALGRHG